MIKTKLKPCPFCGSDDITYDNDVGANDDYFIEYIYCHGCGLRVSSERDIENKWNRRAA